MLEFLKSIFGENVTIKSYEYPINTPAYIRDNYNLQLLSWNEYRCALLSPNSHFWRLPSLKKQFINFRSLCTVPCALYLNGLTAQQRRNLVENREKAAERSNLLNVSVRSGVRLLKKSKKNVLADHFLSYNVIEPSKSGYTRPDYSSKIQMFYFNGI